MHNWISNIYANFKFKNGSPSYSQEGEDRLLENIFKNQATGFYIDVGAHHPYYLSNTNLFYNNGWSGINIDANPDCIDQFIKMRPRDINLALGVGEQVGELKFYRFQEPALSSFDEKLSQQRIKEGRKLLDTIQIKISTLENILDKHLKQNQNIDFMTIDVEGLDLAVLKSNNWKKYRPKILLVECLNLDLENIQNDEICNFLKSKKYKLHAKLSNTCFFMRDN